MTRGPVARRPIALLVGECNPYQQAEVERYALYPFPERSAGGRLCRVILGLEPHLYIRSYARHNLCSRKWSMLMARHRAQELRREYAILPIVLFGAKVAHAFGFAFEPFTRSGRFAVLPHPSGLSRLWNDSGSFERARALMREVGALPRVDRSPRGVGVRFFEVRIAVKVVETTPGHFDDDLGDPVPAKDHELAVTVHMGDGASPEDAVKELARRLEEIVQRCAAVQRRLNPPKETTMATTTIGEAVELTPEDVRLVQKWGGPRQLRGETRGVVLVGRLQRTLIAKDHELAKKFGLRVVDGRIGPHTKRTLTKYNASHQEDAIELGPELAEIVGDPTDFPEIPEDVPTGELPEDPPEAGEGDIA